MGRAVVVFAIAAAGIAVAVLVRSGSGGDHRSPQPPIPAVLPTPPAPSTPTAPPPPPRSPAGEQFGANAGSLFERPTPLPSDQILAALAALRASGGTLVREDALWEATEPQAPVAGIHRYDWRFDDAIASALAAQGLRWLPIIDYAPGWAQASAPVGAVHPPPRDPAPYAAYAAAFAARYGPGGAFWQRHPSLAPLPVEAVELWNEPDNPTFWYPAPNLFRYGLLFADAQRAIAAVAPTVKVILGGLNHPESTLRPLVAILLALHARVDGVSIHPYAPTPAGVLAHVRATRVLLRVLGLGDAALYVTEFGWTTRPPGALDYAPAALRPSYIAQTLTGLSHTNCQIAAVTVFSWVSLEQEPRSYVEWFGLEASRPDREAFAAGVRAASAPSPQRRLC